MSPVPSNLAALPALLSSTLYVVPMLRDAVAEAPITKAMLRMLCDAHFVFIVVVSAAAAAAAATPLSHVAHLPPSAPAALAAWSPLQVVCLPFWLLALDY